MKLKELKLKAPKSAVVLNNREKKAVRGGYWETEDEWCTTMIVCAASMCLTAEGKWGYCSTFGDSGGDCTCHSNPEYLGYYMQNPYP